MDDARRLKLLSRKEEALFQINKTKKRNSRRQVPHLSKGNKKEGKDHRRSKLEKARSSLASFCGLSTLTTRDFISIKRNLIIKRRNNNKR